MQARERKTAHHEHGIAWANEWRSELGVVAGRSTILSGVCVRLWGVVEKRE